MNKASYNRLSNLDILRGLAALAVCFFHFDRESLFKGTFYPEIAKYGYLGVDVFFVISGFVIPLSLSASDFTLRGIWAFWAARFLRLYPAYWRFFGTISYSLYVIHHPIVALEHVIGLRLVGTAFKPFLFLLPIGTMAVCIGAGWGLYMLVEEPTMRLSKKFGMCRSLRNGLIK